MWSFEGDYKKKPKQSLGGRSRVIDRESLLQKLKSEREEREEQRRREEAVLKIQAWCRGNSNRRIVFEELRKACDISLNQIKQTGLTLETAEYISTILTKIFDPGLDSERLLTFCHHLVKEQKKLTKWICASLKKWKYSISKLVGLALKSITYSSQKNDLSQQMNSYAIPLRLLEVVSYPDSWHSKLTNQQKNEFLSTLFVYLLKQGYYSCLMGILLTKVPHLDEASTKPPNPMAKSLLDLMLQPLKVISLTKNEQIEPMLYSELCKEVFDNASQSQVMNFLLPSLVADPNIHLSYIAESLLLYINSNFDWLSHTIAPSSLLFSLLTIVHSKHDLHHIDVFIQFLNVCGGLLERCHLPAKQRGDSSPSLDEDSSSEDEDMDVTNSDSSENKTICDICMRDLNSTDRVSWILLYVEKYIFSPNMLISFTRLFHYISVALAYKLNDCRLFFCVVLKSHLLLRPMWRVLSSLQQGKILPNEHQNGPPGTPLLQVLSLGYPLSSAERNTLVPLLSTFSASLIAVLATLHDSELLASSFSEKRKMSSFPFTVDELVKMSATLRDVCVGFVELAHPDMRMAAYMNGSSKTIWAHCFKVCIEVVRQIYLRDTRRKFCPEGHWLSSKVFLPLKDANAKSFSIRPRRRYRRFEPPRWLTKDELEMDGPPLSVAEQRRSTLLQELPFVFPFEARMNLFTVLVAADRSEHQSTASYGAGIGASINITVRRTHLYEDAFDKLSYNNEPDLRLRMRVSLLNAVGLNEAGIDGGGIFREFLSELLKTAFDPNRGFFLLTRDNTLYPNPSSPLIAADFEKHYYFIGRMVGKALYDNLLVEIPLASFFLTKLLRGASNFVEFHHLDSLDPELCRNLLSLKNFGGDIQDLGLDFTVLNSELGEKRVVELIPNGADILVTNENCIEYIYRMADYKLNKQIARQCQAFKEGLFNVIESRWLRLFNWRELQMMVSGSSTSIDIEGLKSNTVYSGVYHEAHPTIVAFWKVVSGFNEMQRRQLLKFVTSCSRPPLLGFKELFPSFGIQPSGSEDHLPSAFTCMNLLKLPQYKDEETLREKLIYAITSSAGFELS